MLYDIVDDINKATHVKIVGRPGNTDICKLENLTDKVRPIYKGSKYARANFTLPLIHSS